MTTSSSFKSSDSGGGGNKKRKAITPPISAPIIAAAAKIPATTTAAAVSGGVTTTLDSSNNPNNNDKKKKNNPPSSSSVEIVDLRDFLKALPKTKLTLRAKTHVQLEIIDITTTATATTATATKNKKKKMKSASTSTSTSSSCHVVISGAMDLKNLNQLIAYLTGHTQDYNYHSQKGKVVKGSFFLLNYHPRNDDNNNYNNDDNDKNNNLIIGEKSLAKTVGAGGRHHVVDKDIKITQIFQGLITGPTSGIAYDSDIAKNIQLIWKRSNQQAQGSPTYKIVCTGILANKCLLGKQEPLPRVVNNMIGNGKNTISRGFMNGQFLYRTNDIIRGDRKSPPKLSFGGGGNKNKNPRQRTNENAAKPIVNADDGSAVQRPNDDDDDDDDSSNNIKNKGYDIKDLMTKAAFEQKNIESAGLPTLSPVSSTTTS